MLTWRLYYSGGTVPGFHRVISLVLTGPWLVGLRAHLFTPATGASGGTKSILIRFKIRVEVFDVLLDYRCSQRILVQFSRSLFAVCHEGKQIYVIHPCNYFAAPDRFWNRGPFLRSHSILMMRCIKPSISIYIRLQTGVNIYICLTILSHLQVSWGIQIPTELVAAIECGHVTSLRHYLRNEWKQMGLRYLQKTSITA